MNILKIEDYNGVEWNSFKAKDFLDDKTQSERIGKFYVTPILWAESNFDKNDEVELLKMSYDEFTDILACVAIWDKFLSIKRDELIPDYYIITRKITLYDVEHNKSKFYDIKNIRYEYKWNAELILPNVESDYDYEKLFIDLMKNGKVKLSDYKKGEEK